MATTVTANINSTVSGTHSSVLDLATYSSPFKNTYSKAYTTTDVDTFWSDTRTLNGSESLNLLTLTDAFGTALNLSTMKFLRIYNRSTTDNVTVGGGTTPVLANSVAIKPGGCLDLTGSYSVVAASTHLLNVTTSASVSYDVVVVGKK